MITLSLLTGVLVTFRSSFGVTTSAFASRMRFSLRGYRLPVSHRETRLEETLQCSASLSCVISIVFLKFAILVSTPFSIFAHSLRKFYQTSGESAIYFYAYSLYLSADFPYTYFKNTTGGIKMNLESTVTELLEAIIADDSGECLSSFAADLAFFLNHQGCDYYEVMQVLFWQSISVCSEEDARKLYGIVPRHRKLKSLSPVDIHEMIARWTAVPYHSGPIREVVRDIQLKCLRTQVGLSVYNSNLNPNNPKAANDPYLQLVTESGTAFSDLNRKISYYYENGGK